MSAIPPEGAAAMSEDDGCRGGTSVEEGGSHKARCTGSIPVRPTASWPSTWATTAPAEPRNIADVIASLLAEAYHDDGRLVAYGPHKGQPLTVKVPAGCPDHGAWLSAFAEANP